jgi:hypothetical protein
MGRVFARRGEEGRCETIRAREDDNSREKFRMSVETAVQNVCGDSSGQHMRRELPVCLVAELRFLRN